MPKSRKQVDHKLCAQIEKLLNVGSKGIPKVIVNPLTNRKIKTDGPTFLSLIQSCMGTTECAELHANPNRNPFTGKKIANGPSYKFLMKACEAKDNPKMVKKQKQQNLFAIKSILKKPTTMTNIQEQKKVNPQRHVIFKDIPGLPKTYGIKREPENVDAAPIKKRKSDSPRAKLLRQQKGVEFLEAEEVEYILKDHMFGGNLPKDVYYQVIDMTQGGGYFQIQQNLHNGSMAVVYNNEHFVAIKLEITKDRKYHIHYFEPFNYVFPSFMEAFTAVLKLLNNEDHVNEYLHAYKLGWQSKGGPCGVYAATAVYRLATGIDLTKSLMRKKYKPKIVDINKEYEWMADNLDSIRFA